MNNDAEAHWRRTVTVIGLVFATVVALAGPAFAHPVFSNDAPGFPNPFGGTGASGQTPPYAAGSRPTLNMFLPFEQEGVIFNGAENTTVDVQVILPGGWTNPACGAVSTLASTGYRQLGIGVPNWTCVSETAGARRTLHWSGPQVSPSKTNVDSAQFFTFQVTVPSPAAQTSYGAAGGPEGIHVKQTYANGYTSLWKPPNSTQAGVLANGIVRTVASAPPPSPTPKQDGTAQGGTIQGGTHQGGTTQGLPKPGGTTPASPPPSLPGGGAPVTPSAAGMAPTGPTTTADLPGAEAQNSPEVTPSESSPGIDSQPRSVEQLTQQRGDAIRQGLGWPIWAGIALGLVLVAGAVSAVMKRRRAS
jgi:hypothetical protein